jgi:hypothetical protein
MDSIEGAHMDVDKQVLTDNTTHVPPSFYFVFSLFFSQRPIGSLWWVCLHFRREVGQKSSTFCDFYESRMVAKIWHIFR